MHSGRQATWRGIWKGNPLNFLEYYGVNKAFRRYKESLHLKQEPYLNTNEAKPYAVLQSEAKGTKAIRKILSQITTPLPKAMEKWNNIVGSLDWHTVYSSFKRSTSDTNLKCFQYRILNRILTINDYSHKKKWPILTDVRSVKLKRKQSGISYGTVLTLRHFESVY